MVHHPLAASSQVLRIPQHSHQVHRKGPQVSHGQLHLYGKVALGRQVVTRVECLWMLTMQAHVPANYTCEPI
jgi:hypothetical protein